MPKSKIEWTEFTVNPVVGCNRVSPGCDHCYAMNMAARLEAMGQNKYFFTTRKTSRGADWSGRINFDLDALKKAVKRKVPTKFFVPSMGDLFHKDVTFEFIEEVTAIMATNPKHIYQVLTKRPEQLLWFCDYMSHKLKEIGFAEFNGKYFEFPEFIWIGVSVENQDYIHRIGDLKKADAQTKFLSLEPLLGPIKGLNLNGIDWVIIGCESGSKRRECKIEWVEDIVNQCKASNIPVFVKQLQIDGKVVKDIEQFPEQLRVRNYPDA